MFGFGGFFVLFVWCSFICSLVFVYSCQGFYVWFLSPQSCCRGSPGVQSREKGRVAGGQDRTGQDRAGGSLWLPRAAGAEPRAAPGGAVLSWLAQAHSSEQSRISVLCPAAKGREGCTEGLQGRAELPPCAALFAAAQAWQQTWHQLIWLCALLSMNMN